MTLDEYEIRELIGIGGMGAVFRGFHVPTSRPVAIKVLISDESRNFAYRLRMFRRESDNIARLAHASIVQVHQIKQLNGITFVVMDLFLGPTGRAVNLMDYARFFGPASGLLEEDDIQQIFIALLNAVGYAHSRGVVHCDLKPENILFQCVRSTEDGYWDAFLKVTDFGIAKIIGEDMVLRTARGSKEAYGEDENDRPADAHALINTYDFMSPEQRHGKPAIPVSDLFSIGIMMLRMLTGAKELGLPNRPSHPRPGIHPGWDKVIMTAMRENPKERYPDAASMAAAISALKIRKM